MLLYALIHVITFFIASFIIYLMIRPRIKALKSSAASPIFYLAVIAYGGLFPLAYDYVYSTFRKGFFGYAFLLTGVYGVFLMTTAGYMYVKRSGKKDYSRPKNPFMFRFSGYGLLLLIGCAVTMVWVGQYLPMFE